MQEVSLGTGVLLLLHRFASLFLGVLLFGIDYFLVLYNVLVCACDILDLG